MISSTVEQVVMEMKSFPFTMITILCLVGVSIHSSINHASAGEVQAISDQVDRVLTLQIAESIRNLHRQRCSANDAEARRTLARTIDDLQAEYRRLTGARYPLTACG